MPPNVLDGLIDKVDSFEAVRDQIALILADNVAQQQTLATSAAKNPALWEMLVYTERSYPWQQYLNINVPPEIMAPIVNVSFDQSSFDRSGGSVVDRQKSSSTYHIDVYGFATGSDDGAGHKTADEQAAKECQRALRLVRNIIMAGQNTYLQLRGVVWGRWISAITMFQPQIDQRSAVQVVAARISLDVEFNETAEQVTGELLEQVVIDIDRLVDGKIYIQAEYP